MIDEIKPPEDSDSLAPTLRPKAKMPSLSSRPTIPIKIHKLKKPWYNIYFILKVLIIFFICEVAFIYYKYKTRIIPKPTITYNVPTVIIPPDIKIQIPSAVPIEIPTLKHTPKQNYTTNKIKDYGI